ncbi:MAG: hypothetical protein HUJ68_07305 [Clostridia bacterium]|nr:hypothetical protein [Clostridia bacterium]
MSVSLEFDPANLSKSFGFIKYKTKGAYHQTLSINDMADVNYDTTNH